jgi:hypothetical protein
VHHDVCCWVGGPNELRPPPTTSLLPGLILDFLFVPIFGWGAAAAAVADYRSWGGWRKNRLMDLKCCHCHRCDNDKITGARPDELVLIYLHALENRASRKYMYCVIRCRFRVLQMGPFGFRIILNYNLVVALGEDAFCHRYRVAPRHLWESGHHQSIPNTKILAAAE